MKEMIKLEDGTWTYSVSTPKVDLNIDLPDNITIEDSATEKPRRKARERKAKP